MSRYSKEGAPESKISRLKSQHYMWRQNAKVELNDLLIACIDLGINIDPNLSISYETYVSFNSSFAASGDGHQSKDNINVEHPPHTPMVDLSWDYASTRDLMAKWGLRGRSLNDSLPEVHNGREINNLSYHSLPAGRLSVPNARLPSGQGGRV